MLLIIHSFKSFVHLIQTGIPDIFTSVINFPRNLDGS